MTICSSYHYENLLSRIKAVADGSISYFIEHYVISRVAKLSYLVLVDVLYDPSNDKHRRRIGNVYTKITGEKCVTGALSVVLSQVGLFIQSDTEVLNLYWLLGNDCS